jgi:hypothetical protein
MLRRKPTALTVTSEDIAAFEEHHARQLALLRFQKTGEDPNAYFTNNHNSDNANGENNGHAEMRDAMVDPNDELKPLPGDKARIVRGREERIMGVGSGSAAGARR